MNRIFKIRERKTQATHLEKYVESLDEKLDCIARTYFDPIIEQQVLIFGSPEDNLEDYAREDYKQRFKKVIARYLGDHVSESNVSEHLINMLLNTQGWTERSDYLENFDLEIAIVFCRNLRVYQGYDRIINTKIIVLIAKSIQALTIDIPLWIFSGDDPISEIVKKSLVAILSDIDQMSKHFGLEYSIPNFADVLKQLYRKIFQADGHVWLPLIPLVTSPLANRDLVLYARDSQPADRLAKSIVRGDGVTLIAGYRGVGKSTFINAVLQEHVIKADERQSDPIPWKIIPIYVSVAKVAGVENVLRLCIRQLYGALSNDEIQPFLKTQEISDIKWAYRRASFKVDLLQLDSFVESDKLQITFGINPSEYLSDIPVVGKFSSLIPSFSGESSEERKKQVDHTISLLDYNEDRAEEDIVELIKKMATPRNTPIGRRRIKLVFIFDELDKMDEVKGQLPLIMQLKNLFLTRNAVFFLVTSKDFYYLWLKDRRNEDSLLSSYFSSIVMVPIFTTLETKKLVRNLIDLPEGENLTDSEKSVVEDLAYFLTYRAAGLPREIIRELRLMQEWLSGSLQTYVSDQTGQINIIRIYATIQRVLDDLDAISTNVQDVLPAQKDTAAELETEEIIATPEYLWFHEASQEQIRRGRYILVEEMLNRGGLVISMDELRSIYEDNFTKKPTDDKPSKDDVFSLVSEEDFLAVVEELAWQLSQKVNYQYEGESHKLFLFDKANPDKPKVIVADIFYEVTKRKTIGEEQQYIPEAEEYTVEQIFKIVNDLFVSDSQFSRQRAFSYLNQSQLRRQDFPPEINQKLVEIVFSSAPENHRLKAASYLTGTTFIKSTADWPENFIAEEENQSVLRLILRFLSDANQDQQNHDRVRVLLMALISAERTASQQYSEGIWGSMLQIWAEITEKDDLVIVIDKLPEYNQISESVFQPLLRVAKETKQIPLLLRRMVQNNYGELPRDTLNESIKLMNLEELLLVWDQIFSNKTQTLANQILISILASLPNKAKSLPVQILSWLNSSSWSETDTNLLQNGINSNPRLPGYLSSFKQITNSTILELIAPPSTASRPTKVIDDQVSTRPTPIDPPRTFRKRHYGVIVFLSIIIAAIYVALPYDLTADATIGVRLLERFLQFIYMWSPIGLLGAILLTFITWNFEDRWMPGCFIGVAVGVVFLGITSLLVSINILNMPITLSGHLRLYGLQILMFVIPIGGEELYHRITQRNQKK